MEIGNDDLDFIDDLDSEDVSNYENQDDTYQDLDINQQDNENLDERNNDIEISEQDDFITSLLATVGIKDKSKIKFENEDGETEEVNWDSLDNETKLNIFNSSRSNSNDLDDTEVQLINAIRQSQLSPQEYIQYIYQEGANNYSRQLNVNNYAYKVDDLNDDELYIADLMTRTGMTEQEAQEALDRAKVNESLFNKQIGAIRSEYQKSEAESIRYNEFRQQEVAQEQFNQFAGNVRDQIIDFTEFAGYDLNMEEEDMQELYDFITGFDAAGNSYFGKALNDPPTLVRMAWFALNGEQMIQDINDYYKKEIANVRKESYNKGVQASKDKPNIVHKNIPNYSKSKSQVFDDLDDI